MNDDIVGQLVGASPRKLLEDLARIAAALAERGIGHGELRTDRERGSGLPSTADPSLEAVTARLRPVRGLA